MRTFILLFFVFTAAVPLGSQPANLPELSTMLSLFSAHATSPEAVRLNWMLEQQSPLITTFRIFRGYEELGNFAVLSEVDVHQARDTVEYTYMDTDVRPGVSYYYKISAVGQSSESVFPVVITATPPLPGQSAGAELTPAALIPGAKITLYVRTPGRVKLSIEKPRKALVDDVLRPGIYEFEPPSAAVPLSLHLEHEQGFTADATWPIQ